MAKRKRPGECPTHPTPRRKSARLEAQTEDQLPSPSPSFREIGHSQSFREVGHSPSFGDTQPEVGRSQSFRDTQAEGHSQPCETYTDAIAHWALNSLWPPRFFQQGFAMAESSGKRKSSTTHRSVYVKRMAKQGLIMDICSRLPQKSRDVCRSYLGGDRRPTFPSFPVEKLLEVINRIYPYNEARLQRDITPLIVPSAELLFFCGELTTDWIADEVNADWSRCITLGSKQPKPDYTAGLMREAFTDDEIGRLEQYSTSSRHFLVTPELCFPFLVCEAKTGERGMNEADRQNLHSASIAVRAIFELYKTAFGDSDTTKALYGQVLVFAVSHNNDTVNIYGHFAVFNDGLPEQLEYHRHLLDSFSLRVHDGENAYRSYNFVRNVYDKFVPEHLQRIKDAVALLPAPAGPRTGLSFNASELSLETDSASFKKPEEPLNLAKQVEIMRRQMDQQRNDAKEMEEKMQEREFKLLEQMEKQRNQAKEEREKMQEHMEQQRNLVKEEREKMKEQMERLISAVQAK